MPFRVWGGFCVMLSWPVHGMGAAPDFPGVSCPRSAFRCLRIQLSGAPWRRCPWPGPAKPVPGCRWVLRQRHRARSLLCHPDLPGGRRATDLAQGEGARWRETMGMGCHRNPSLLSPLRVRHSPAPPAPHPDPAAGLRRAPGDGAGARGGAARGPGPRGAPQMTFIIFLCCLFLSPIQDIVLQAARAPAALPEKISPYLPPRAPARGTGEADTPAFGFPGNRSC